MKIKDLQKLRDENPKELMLQAQRLKEEIARLSVEAMVNRPKNTNAIGRRKQELAAVLTIVREKRS